MQSYLYSVFSGLAIVIHLIINFPLLFGHGEASKCGKYYRGFLLGTLAYYVTDAAWGVLAGLDWKGVLYVETAFFFLSLVAFVFMWGRFVVAYLELGKWAARLLAWSGYALLAYNLVGLAANPFNDCFYHFDAQGVYQTGAVRDTAFALLFAYILLVADLVFVKAMGSRDAIRRRSMMVFMVCIVVAVSLILQVIWVLTPFTALGCLVGNCFFHIFVIQDEQSAKHTAELEKALDRVRMAEMARNMFFNIVNHDIRTPLNAIHGYAELLQIGLRDQAERDAAVESIRASSTTLLDIVNDVLDLAKMDAGKLTLEPVPVRLSKLTDEVFASFRMAAERKGLELANRTADVPTVLLDEPRFRQILSNLVGNAVKFTGHGSVTVAATHAGTDLEVSVSDTGCGIPHDMQAIIFEPFVQARDPTHSADRDGGTGLGLPICRRLVEMMGGGLFVESEPGQGSTFRVRIPGVVAEAADTVPAEAPEPVPAEGKRPVHVLVVDDSPVNRSVLTAFLKRAGVPAIDQAGDGTEALAQLDSAAKAGNPHDFVFSDFWMPNMSGVEFVEKLRADARFARLPVYAVTADTEFQRDGRTSLFTGILLKPLTYAKLVGTFSPAAGGQEGAGAGA